ncbi:hypothetical protein BD779DRAFT_1493809 [Infundibulicybe gibba]|nr:hypothetical protein BD779DRAFT_1493809 [Infundibulicybe gibba]
MRYLFAIDFCLMSGLVVIGINAHLTALTTASSLGVPTHVRFHLVFFCFAEAWWWQANPWGFTTKCLCLDDCR